MATEQEVDNLYALLRAIRKALTTDSDGEYHSIRRWLDKHHVYHDDLSGLRVIEEAVKIALKGQK